MGDVETGVDNADDNVGGVEASGGAVGDGVGVGCGFVEVLVEGRENPKSQIWVVFGKRRDLVGEKSKETGVVDQRENACISGVGFLEEIDGEGNASIGSGERMGTVVWRKESNES